MPKERTALDIAKYISLLAEKGYIGHPDSISMERYEVKLLAAALARYNVKRQGPETLNEHLPERPTRTFGSDTVVYYPNFKLDYTTNEFSLIGIAAKVNNAPVVYIPISEDKDLGTAEAVYRQVKGMAADQKLTGDKPSMTKGKKKGLKH